MRSWFAILLVGAFTGQASAHPHVEMEAKITLLAEAGGGQSLRVEWLFDDYYSGLIIQNNRRNGKGAFSSQEIESIRRKQFENTKEFNYFLQPVYDGGKPIRLLSVRDFTVRIEGDRLRYLFTVPLPAQKTPKPLTVTLADPENFVKLIMPRYGAVEVEGPGKAKIVCKRIRAPDIQTVNGLIEPDAMRCAPPGKS